MKKYLQISLMSLLVLVGAGRVWAADELSLQLQKGLLAEEAHRDYNAALKAYQAAVAAYDTNRQAAATAVFRLAETYRKLGRTNEARVQYERVVLEFPDQSALVGAANTQLQNDFKKQGVPNFLREGDTQAARDRYLWNEQRMKEAQLAGLKKLNPSQLAVAIMQQSYNDQLNALLKSQDELTIQRASKLKEFSPGHPEIEKLDAALKQIQEQAATVCQVILQQMEEKLRLSRELMSGEGAVAAEPSVTGGPSEIRNKYQEQLRQLVERAASGEGSNSPFASPERRANRSAPQIPAEEEGEIGRLQAMLKNSPDLINGRVGENERAPLHEAAAKGNVQVARFLLSNGAKVNLKAKYDYTPLHLAAESGHKAMVEFLLEKGGQVDPKLNKPEYKTTSQGGRLNLGTDQATPLFLATEKGFGSVVEVLLSKGASLAERDKAGYTPLHRAVANEDLELVKLLIDNKADVNTKAASGPGRMTTLEIAAKNGNVPLMKVLIAAGADVDQGKDGWNALYEAVINGKSAAVDLLLANNANPNTKSSGGQTPLLRALTAEIAEKLLKAGADVNAATEAGHTPLLAAVDRNDRELLSLLLRFKANPNLRSGGQGVPLLKAVSLGAAETVESLIQAGANVEVTDEQGYSALHYAVANGDLSLVEMLLKRKVKPDEAAKTGYTPLMLAQRGLKSIFTGDGGPASARVGQLGPKQVINEQYYLVENLPAPFKQIGELLIQQGADQFRNRRSYIVVSRQKRGMRQVVFTKDGAGVNRYSLFELLSMKLGDYMNSGELAFPDFSHITIERLEAGKIKIIPVSIAAALEVGDCTGDIWLEWGDVVEIPEVEHNLSEPWSGLKESIRNTLSNCGKRNVKLTVKGQTYDLSLLPASLKSRGTFSGGPSIPGSIPPRPGSPFPVSNTEVVTNFVGCRLSTTVFESKALLSSSDTKRVKITRKMGTGGKKEMMYDIGYVKDSTDDLWLRDGDVIEVPEKE